MKSAMRQMVESLSVGAAFIEGENIRFNSAAYRMIGYAPSELTTLEEVFRVLWPNDIDARQFYEDERRQGFPISLIIPLHHKDGRTISIEFSAFNREDCTVWLMHNVTRRRAAEEALKRSRQQMASILAHMNDGVFSLALSPLNIEYMNAAALRICGWSGRGIPRVSEIFSSIIHPGDHTLVKRGIAKIFQKKLAAHPFRIVWHGGETRWVHVKAWLIEDEHGRPLRIDGMLNDMTGHRQVHEALRQSQDRFKLLYDSMNEMVVLHKVVYDDKGKAIDYTIVDCNREFSKVAGIACHAVGGASAAKLFGTAEAPFLDTYARVAETRVPISFETYFAPMCKYLRISVFSPMKGHFATVASDITEKKLAEKEKEQVQQQLMRSNKMIALGQLAAGVAHELNNPMTIIMGNVQYLQRNCKDESTHELLRTVDEACHRCKKIVSDLLDFSRYREIMPQPCRINEVLDHVLSFAAYQSDFAGVAIERTYADLPLVVEIDRSRFEQVLLNIVINAGQAMHGEGKLKVDARLTDAHMVAIAFTDTGEGIPPENVQRIFDPFFTTKQKGTGLGLSICYEIIKQHQGDMIVSSEGKGQGTTFTVLLPLAQQDHLTCNER